MDWLVNIDRAVLDEIQDNLKCGFLDTESLIVSFLGGAVIWLVLGVLFCFWKKRLSSGAAIIFAVLFSIVISEFAIKLLFMRERPFLFNDDVVLLVSPPFGTSFPSSHTMQSFAAAIVFFYIDKRFGVCALIFAFFVGFSRLYLYVHYPSDVLAGALIGVGIGFMSVYLFKWLAKRPKLQKLL